MVGYSILGMLAAFGVVSLLWAAFGWLLREEQGWILVRFGMPEKEILTKFKLLRGLGILEVPLVAVAEQPVQGPAEIEICSREDLLSRLEWERKRFDRTGNGDYPGRHQCRGISEL